MQKSVSIAARDVKLLELLAMVPTVVATCVPFLIGLLALIWSLDNALPLVPWVLAAIGGLLIAIALSWLATQVRRGSTGRIRTATVLIWLVVLLDVIWWSRAGNTILFVFLTALAPMILAISSGWALRVARRLHSRYPGYLSRPHATRRLSLPRDVRMLHAAGSAVLGSLRVLGMICVGLVLVPFLRGGGVGMAASLFMPGILRSFRRARAVLSLRAQEVRLSDQRLPVLFLRSFADDELPLKRAIGYHHRPLLALEEQIVEQLWEIGPVIAIGQPGTKTDPIGAAREYLGDSLWQARVQSLMDESSLSVVVLGQTEGLLWEYAQLAQRKLPVLAIWPPADSRDLIFRWLRFTAVYPPAREVVLGSGPEFPILAWFPKDREPLLITGERRDERSFALAFSLLRYTQ